ncbi:MAG: hypothetical protein NTX97_01605, partial [Bacteroidetes bacterium]|nr:hypothetical protein [Bacteroidota bacterium]
MEKIYSKETLRFLTKKKSIQNNNKKSWITLCVALFLFLVAGILNVCQGQTTIYTQDFGTGTTAPSGWTTSGTNAQFVTSSVSTTYSGASGGTNMSDGGTSSATTATANPAIITTTNISTVGYSSPITLSYGYRISSTSYTGTIKAEYSTNGGSTWTVYNNAASGSGLFTVTSAAWTLMFTQTLTGAAGISNLKLRWTFTRTNTSGNFRIDDITIQGASASPSIALSSPSQIAAGNLLQGSVDQPISNFQAAVTTANATLNTLAFVTGNGGGSYAASDITNFKLYFNATSNTFGSASQIGTTQSGVASGSTVTFSSLATTINSGSTGYFWITSSIASGASVGNKFNANASPTLTFTSGTPTGSISSGGNQTISAFVVPTITIANGTISSGNITQNSTNTILYRTDVTISIAAATLNSASFTTAGTYSSGDLTNLKLWYQTSSTFNSGTATLLVTKTTSLGAGSQVFSSLAQSFPIGTGYLFVTCDLPCSAVLTKTININAISVGGLTFASGIPTGSSFTAGGSQTVTSATPADATAAVATATNNSGEVSVSWTNPIYCFNEVMIVAAPAPNTGAPSTDGSGYTSSLSYNSGTALGNGFVVYKGNVSSQTITGLTDGTVYYLKLFTRNGTSWSAGIEVSATPASTLYLNTFTGTGVCPTQGNTPVMVLNSTGAALTRSTITCNSTGDVFNSSTLNVTSSVSNTSYIEFSATANSGYLLNLSSLSFFRQASNTGPNQLEVKYSTDGFVTSTSWGSAPITPILGTVITWDFTDFSTSNGGTVTFRVFPYGTQRADLTGASGSTGTFRLDDVSLYGSVTAAPTAGAIGSAQTICNGATPAALTSITAGSGSGTITYEWQTNASGTFVTIAGVTAATYAPPALTATTSYQRRTVSVSGGTTCYSAYTTPVTITVNSVVTAGAIGSAQTICNGATPSAITSTTAGTGSGIITYEWQTNTSGTYVTITGATAATYAPPALTVTTSYQRRTVSVNAGTTCYSAYTTPVTITTTPTPAITCPSAITVAAGAGSCTTTVTYTATSTTPGTTITYSIPSGSA